MRSQYHPHLSAAESAAALDLTKSNVLKAIGNERLPPPTAKLRLTF